MHNMTHYLQRQWASAEDPQARHTVNRRAEIEIVRVVDTDRHPWIMMKEIDHVNGVVNARLLKVWPREVCDSKMVIDTACITYLSSHLSRHISLFLLLLFCVLPPCHAMPCHAIRFYAMQFNNMSSPTMLCTLMFQYIVLCNYLSCHTMPSLYAMPELSLLVGNYRASWLPAPDSACFPRP